MLLKPNDNEARQPSSWLEYQTPLNSSFLQQLVDALNSESIPRLTFLCWQLGDSFAKDIATQVLFSKKQNQTLISLVHGLSSQLIKLIGTKALIKPSCKKPKLRYQQLIIRGSENYVEAIMASHIRRYKNIYSEIKAGKDVPILPGEVSDEKLEKLIFDKCNQSIIALIFRKMNEINYVIADIEEVELCSAFRWFMLEHKIGLRDLNRELKLFLPKLNSILRKINDELAKGPSDNAQLLTLLTLLYSFIRYREPLNFSREELNTCLDLLNQKMSKLSGRLNEREKDWLRHKERFKQQALYDDLFE